MAYRIFQSLCGKGMTEEQQDDEPDSPSTQFGLTPHDGPCMVDDIKDINEVLKELNDRVVAMEKRLQDIVKLCKNLSTERMEGNSTNPQLFCPLLSSYNDDEGDEHLSHAEETERTPIL